MSVSVEDIFFSLCGNAVNWKHSFDFDERSHVLECAKFKNECRTNMSNVKCQIRVDLWPMANGHYTLYPIPVVAAGCRFAFNLDTSRDIILTLLNDRSYPGRSSPWSGIWRSKDIKPEILSNILEF